MPGDERESLDRLRGLQRDAETGGPLRLLGRIAAEIDGHAALFDRNGAPLTPHRGLPDAITGTVRRVRSGGTRSAVEHDGQHQLAAFALSTEPDAPTLALAGPSLDRFTAEPGRTDALRLLALSWRAHHAQERWRRADEAGDQVREAVLHLLIDGGLATAHRTAGALGEPLPDPMRVWVVEVGALERGERDAVAEELLRITGDRAWMIKCPVYSGHLIPAVPPMSHEEERACAAELVATATASTGRISVGISNVLPLRDYAVAYQQAFHALAHARGNAERFATFGRGHDLAAEIAGPGQRWARQVLAGLEEFTPQRPQDPTREELQGTLTSWLMFHQQAARHLKIHRNTLQARLHKIGALLDRDLHRLHDQACVDLALRLRNSGAPEGSGADDLDALLRSDAVRRWAAQLLAPLRESPRLRETVRAWLLADTHLTESAEALGLSTTAVRKRLARAEQLLERSLLHSPSLSYDLHFAFRALNPLG
ncbi:helix-turn-helix domain-containing protein [Saccharopolyspora sp. TS4A08]|uniref:Helix-turn-helix domain-containing protein n=1 Tax=Saccharopolyspora ipomoeae TaxID=3042027 RepID=A0ABT6PHV3_9PSEU|nr:helix-turn-helix domain-containing protein [Saccharopolyspora sp. TS4A08]MDI2027565.1 helix-turn-helix domain-containing protein [Saccharopolyspora sp. TS4A08]